MKKFHLGGRHLQPAATRSGTLDLEAAGRPSRGTRASEPCQQPDHWQGAQKNDLNPWQVEQWCLPPQGSAARVCAMEDVLKVCRRPRDEKRPLVCLDEMGKQLIADVRRPQPALPGLTARVDYEHVQRVHGVCAAGAVVRRACHRTAHRATLGADRQTVV